jgi:hypothetical protein
LPVVTAENVSIVSWWTLTIGYLSLVLRGLHWAWSRRSGFDYLEGTAWRVQVRRGQRTWRFSARESEGGFFHTLMIYTH